MLIRNKPQSKKAQFQKQRGKLKSHCSPLDRNPQQNVYYIIALSEMSLHLVHFRKLKRIVKRLKKGGWLGVTFKIWIQLNLNSIRSTKGTNSRMGKGKGEFKTFKLRYRPYTNLIKLFNLPIEGQLVYFTKLLYKITNYRFGSYYIK